MGMKTFDEDAKGGLSFSAFAPGELVKCPAGDGGEVFFEVDKEVTKNGKEWLCAVKGTAVYVKKLVGGYQVDEVDSIRICLSSQAAYLTREELDSYNSLPLV